MLSTILVLASELEAADRAVIATDARGKVVYWGAGAHGLFGWDEKEVVGRDILDVTPTDLSRDHAASIMDALGRGEPWSGEFLVRGRDGKKFAADVVDIPVHDRNGALAGVIGITRRGGYMAAKRPAGNG